MIRILKDEKYDFKTIFNTKTGAYVRFSDEFMASFPHLIDIGIQGSCDHGKSGLCLKAGIKCYQNGLKAHKPNMTLENYKRIIDEIKKKTFQCLGENEIVLIRNQLTGCVAATRIQDVNIGDEIYTGNNDYPFAKVTEVHKGKKESFCIKLPYGKTIIATSEHRFPTANGTLKTVRELCEGDILIQSNIVQPEINEVDAVKCILSANAGNSFYLKGDAVQKYYHKKTVRIETIKKDIGKFDYTDCVLSVERSPWTFPTKYAITEDLMILLGHYVGNGSRRSFVISNKQTKMIESIKHSLNLLFPQIAYNVKQRNNTTVIECPSFIPGRLFDVVFGCRTLEQEKQIPNFIFNVSDDLKKAFLQGYFCDGNFRVVTNDGHYASITFNTSSQKLYNDLTLLLHSLDIGYRCITEKEKNIMFSKTDTRLIHRRQGYRIHVANLYELHKIPDVVAQHKNGDQMYEILNIPHQKRGLREYKKELVVQSIQSVGQVNVVDINIDTEDHLFLTTHGIITHNCALGGAGDPDMHENFEEIMKYSFENHVIPNFTTSGLGMTPEKAAICKKYAGAVAVSMYSRLDMNCIKVSAPKHEMVKNCTPSVLFTKANQNPNCYISGTDYIVNGEKCSICDSVQAQDTITIYNEKTNDSNYTFNAIKMLVDAGVTTSIHYVLSNTTIDEALIRLKHNGFPDGIHAVIFLLHKPVGLGDASDVLQYDDPRLKEFFALVDNGDYPFKIGFDSCTIPGIINFCKQVNPVSLDTCEAGRYSMYITADMIALPCSFDNQAQKYAYDISNDTIQNAWNSEPFNKFRASLRTGCQNCPNNSACMGGCPLEPSIVLCNKKEKRT